MVELLIDWRKSCQLSSISCALSEGQKKFKEWRKFNPQLGCIERALIRWYPVDGYDHKKLFAPACAVILMPDTNWNIKTNLYFFICSLLKIVQKLTTDEGRGREKARESRGRLDWRWNSLRRFGTHRSALRTSLGRCRRRCLSSVSASQSAPSATTPTTMSSKHPSCWTAPTPSAWSASPASWPSRWLTRTAAALTSLAPSAVTPPHCPRRDPRLWPLAAKSSAGCPETSSRRRTCGLRGRSCATMAPGKATATAPLTVPRPSASALTLGPARQWTLPSSRGLGLLACWTGWPTGRGWCSLSCSWCCLLLSCCGRCSARSAPGTCAVCGRTLSPLPPQRSPRLSDRASRLTVHNIVCGTFLIL